MKENIDLLTTELAAKVLGVAVGTLRNWTSTQAQKIPTVRIGRLVRFRQADLERWVNQHTHNPIVEDENEKD